MHSLGVVTDDAAELCACSEGDKHLTSSGRDAFVECRDNSWLQKLRMPLTESFRMPKGLAVSSCFLDFVRLQSDGNGLAIVLQENSSGRDNGWSQ